MTLHPFDADPGDPLDPAQQQALDAVLAAPDLSAAELDRLHRSIMLAAAPGLAARRAAAAPRLSASRLRGRTRWFAPVLPLAAAAALLMVIRQPDPAELEFHAEDAALLADVPDHEFSLLVSGHADAAALLLLAVSGDGDEPY
jgi:hypothetical protein